MRDINNVYTEKCVSKITRKKFEFLKNFSNSNTKFPDNSVIFQGKKKFPENSKF